MQNIMNEQAMVSIVVATYNMAHFIDQTIDSLLCQSWKTIEIIVVDDGSTDNTDEVMSRYKSDGRVSYIKNTNQGQPKAKNCGIQNTHGDYIAFCDADDLWEPDKLVKQMPLFCRPEIGIVYSEVSYIDNNNRRYDKEAPYDRYSGKVTEQLLHKNFVPFGTAVIRRACIEKSGVFDETFQMGIDWDLWLRYSLDWEFDYIEEKTYIYREWPGQMSTNYVGRYKFAIDILEKFAVNYGPRIQKKALRYAWADMYISRGLIYAKNERIVIKPLIDVLHGLSFQPSNFTGWKAIIKILCRWDAK